MRGSLKNPFLTKPQIFAGLLLMIINLSCYPSYSGAYNACGRDCEYILLLVKTCDNLCGNFCLASVPVLRFQPNVDLIEPFRCIFNRLQYDYLYEGFSMLLEIIEPST